MEDMYYKQKKLIHPDDGQPQIFIYGCGSIGSHTTISLTKIGLKEIRIYDYDEVEKENLPSQFYSTQHSEGQKVKKLREMTELMTGTRISYTQAKIEEKTGIFVPMESIHILAFDNIEARKIMLKKLEGYPVHIIDGRIGGYQYEKYYIRANEEQETKEYEKTLKGEFSELECGEKTLWPVNQMIASRITADVIKIIKKQKPSYMEKGNLMGHLIINKQEVNEK